MTVFQPNDPVEVRSAQNTWHRATARSGIEPTYANGRKIHDFPVIWVVLATRSDWIPWPAEDVRHYPQPTD